MRQTRGTMWRMVGVASVAVATLIASAGGAAALSAAPLAGAAKSQALQIKLTIPGTAQIKAALVAAGLPLGSLDTSTVDGLLPGITLTETISLSNSTVAHGVASGFAQPLSGNIVPPSLTPRAATATCSLSKCTPAAHDETSALKVDLIPGVADLGTIRVAGASADAASNRDITAEASLASVRINLADLLGRSDLKPISDALGSLEDTFNTVVRPQVNSVVDSVKTILDQNVPSDVNNVIKSIITIGEIQPMPDLRTEDLLSLKILPSTSTVSPTSSRIVSSASSGVANVSVIGNWLKIGSIEAIAKSFVDLDPQGSLDKLKADNTVGAQAAKLVDGLAKNVGASKDLKLTNVDLFGPLGLLQVLSPELQVINDTGYNNLMAALRKDTQDLGLGSVSDNLLNALDIAYHTAGIQLDKVVGSTSHTNAADILNAKSSATSGEAQLGMAAQATSDFLRLTVEPKIPLLGNKLDTITGGTIPHLTAADYASTGLKLEVDFPQATTLAEQGAAVLGFKFKRTGIGTSWLAVMMLFGAAVGIKRFALSK